MRYNGIMKKLIAVILFCVGFLMSYAIYSFNTMGGLGNFSLILPLFCVALCSVIVSYFFNKRTLAGVKYYLYSLLVVYSSCFLVLVGCSFFDQDYISLVFFSPIIFIYLLPLILMSILSIQLISVPETKR